MKNNVAVYLDLDNFVIGASEAKLDLDYTLLLDHLREITGGRITLRRAYGDWRHHQTARNLANIGFELQSVVRLNSSDKNLADMQMTTDAIETLLDGLDLDTYVIVSGDRDFIPLVQVLRKRGKFVIGVGLEHSTSNSLVDLCDKYVFYNEIAEEHNKTSSGEMEKWLKKAVEKAFLTTNQVQASIFRSEVQEASNGQFSQSKFSKKSFSKLLSEYPRIIHLRKEATTLFVCKPGTKKQVETPLRDRYRTALRKKGMRVVPAELRLKLIQDLVKGLQEQSVLKWAQTVELIEDCFEKSSVEISRTMINDGLRLARRANVIALSTEEDKPLSSMPVELAINGSQTFRDAVILCDNAYLNELQALEDLPFKIEDAALCLYDSADKVTYLQFIIDNVHIRTKN